MCSQNWKPLIYMNMVYPWKNNLASGMVEATRTWSHAHQNEYSHLIVFKLKKKKSFSEELMCISEIQWYKQIG